MSTIARSPQQEDGNRETLEWLSPSQNVSSVYGEINFPSNTSSSDLGGEGQVWTSRDYDNTSIAVFRTGDFLVGAFVQDMSDSQRETAVGNIGALVAGGDSGSSADFQGPDVPFWLIWGLMLLAGLIVVYLILDSRDLITQDLFS